MTIELTARLTLSSCVSQLTSFYDAVLVDALVENLGQVIHIRLVDMDGQLLPFTIVLSPEGFSRRAKNLIGLNVKVKKEERYDGELGWSTPFHLNLQKDHMTTRDLYKCALHICGDFIKFSEKGQ